MRNRHFLKVMAIALTVCLEFGNLQMTAYASQVQDETTVTEEYDSVEADEQKDETSEAEATKASEETNSQETSTEEVSDEEGLIEENSQEEVIEGVTTEENTTESERTEENSDEESLDEENSDEQISEEETSEEEITEDITEEISTEEETTEEETTEELTLEFMEEELLGAATAESDFTWNGNTITRYNGSAKNVVIPERAQAIGGNAFAYNKTIESVTITKNIIEIGTAAFSNCSNLKTVIIESNKIGRTNGCGNWIFEGCNISKVVFADNMTYIPKCLFQSAGFQSGASITIPAGVTEIGDNAFQDAKNLANVTFAGNKVTKIGMRAFTYTSIQKISLPSSVLTIGGSAFGGCTKLKEIVIPENVTGIGNNAFYNCSGLKTVKILTKKLNRTSGCGFAIFSGCSINKVEFADGITYIPNALFSNAGFETGSSIVIPKSVTEIGDSAFCETSGLSKLTFAGNQVKKIGECAFKDSEITTLSLPESVQTIGASAFSGCTNLKEIVIPSNVTSIGASAFYRCTGLETVKIKTTKIARTDGCGYWIFQGCNINKVEFAEGTTYIPNRLFLNAGFESGSSVTIPAGVTTVGDGAFCNAYNLSKVTFAGNQVTSIGWDAFRGTAIEKISLPESVTSIGANAFSGCSNLAGIVIPSNVTSIGNYAFYDCSALQTITIKTAKLPLSGSCGTWIFEKCNINKVELSDNMTCIPDNLFYGAGFESGTEVVIPKEVTTIGSSAFAEAEELSGVIFAGNKVKKIGYGAFSNTRIEKITLPENLEVIDSYAFSGCSYLSETSIPSKVTSIGASAFYGCTNLTKIVLPKSVDSIGYTAFPVKDYIKVYAVKDSYAYNWAKEKGYNIIESYSIAYNLNGGINGSGNPTAYEKGESLSFKNPTREGYTFAGWYADSSCTKKFSYTTSTTGNLTLYAKWNINTYNITYVVNGGTLAKNSPTTYTAAMTVALKNPTRAGYTFIGWYTDSKCSEANKITKIDKGSAGNKTLYAGWKEYSYTIKFAPNGAKVTGTQADMTDCAYSKNVTLTKCAYTRPGYTFAGWNTKADGKGTSYADKATVSKLVAKNNGTITLYAVWKENTYSITYNLNGGTNHAKNPSSYTTTKSVTLANPTRVGYTFKGWYSDAGFTQKITAIKSGSTGTVKVYAKWEVNKYHIQFNANGGKGKMDKLAGCEYGKSYTLTKNAFTRDGYTFKGWNTNAKGTGTWYWNASSVKNLTDANNKTIILYAIWTENTYSITYNLNGGTNNAKNTTTYATVRGITFANPTRVGYTFKGWYSDAGCTQKITAIKRGTAGAVTVYAKWEVNKYHIQFNANGGKGKMDKLAGCEYGKSYTLTKNAFTRDGYTFKGWNTNAKGTGTWYWNASSVKNLTDANNKTIMLYAIWTENTYSITYNLNGGTNNAKNPTTYATVRGASLANPTKEGYTFKGWYTDWNCTQKITAIKRGTAGAVTVYAKWEVNKYHIQFNANGGKGKMDKLAGCEYGKSYTLTKNAFTRDGYTFKGWNTNAKGTGTWYWNASSVKNLTDANNKTIMLYAIWTENTYSITYNLNGGTNNAKNPTTYATVRGTSLANPTKEGYTFKGWYTDWNCTQKITAIKRGTAGAVTVYAKWEANKYTIQFHANGGTGKMDRLTGCEYGKSYTLTKNAFTKAGYTFKGWNTNAKGTGTWYWNASSVKNLTTANNKTVTLYAIWVKN